MRNRCVALLLLFVLIVPMFAQVDEDAELGEIGGDGEAMDVTKTLWKKILSFLSMGATEFTQILNNAQLILIQVHNVKMLADMVKNSAMHPNLLWTNTAADIRGLDMSSRFGLGLSSHLSGEDSRFRTLFEGYRRYSGQMSIAFRRWNGVVMDTLSGQIRSGAQRHAQMLDEITALDKLRLDAKSADGRLKVQQTHAAIGAEQVDQLMKLRDLIGTDMDTRAVLAGMEQQKEATALATQEWFFQFEQLDDQHQMGFSIR